MALHRWSCKHKWLRQFVLGATRSKQAACLRYSALERSPHKAKMSTNQSVEGARPSGVEDIIGGLDYLCSLDELANVTDGRKYERMCFYAILGTVSLGGT
jgi:hypothetical protein